ncbi:MAG: hypothetical protein F6K37_20510 [Moorea sp. SIO4E2]|uniref:hypothetical protein n=1 Tax=Moorena sp. SIO4E2 TaxID=2607826 RepID=UPI0013B7093B|nr:hypothetical protein [Moorena sp. SIO4E2]NEQ08244.1 hypothetical protein [Moorena sp. SIO4E2]
MVGHDQKGSRESGIGNKEAISYQLSAISYQLKRYAHATRTAFSQRLTADG